MEWRVWIEPPVVGAHATAVGPHSAMVATIIRDTISLLGVVQYRGLS